MKLSKLYCNKPFQNTTFFIEEGGLNVILGDAKENIEGNSHCLGKSKLGELIDFMLLKKHNDFFFYKNTAKNKFIEHEFYLEILLNDSRYLTIKRTIATPTKIAFKLQNISSKDYVLYENFDTNEVFTLEKAKKYLNDLLAFDFCIINDENYRRILHYSLRTQGDYEPKHNTLFQLSKFIKGKDIDWKPLIFSLLGFNGAILKEKYKLENDIKDESKVIKAQEKDFDIKVEDKDLLVGKIQNIEIEKESMANELSNLDFYNQDKSIIENLVGSIEAEIATLNTQSYHLEYEIDNLEKSIRNQFSFDIQKVQKIFKEVEINFSENLAKSYQDLVTFNHQITKERNAQILQTLKEKKEKKMELNQKLFTLNATKLIHKDLIQDTSLFKKYGQYQRKLVDIEKELTRYQMQLEGVEEIEKKKDHIQETQTHQLQELKNKVKEIIDNTVNCVLYMNIRKTFSEIVKKILHENALISITPSIITYNIDFKADFPNSEKQDGATYYKILCIAFDLAVLINYRTQSYFRFVYHDDVVAGDDNGVKTRLIQTIQEICLQHDIQYIFSAVKDNIPANQNVEKYLIMELHDKSDDGKLFKISF